MFDRKILHNKDIQAILIREAKKGNIKARDLLLESIQGFIITIIRMKAPNIRIEEDLYQEVYLRLISDAIPQFDSSKGVPFRTYAVYWIMSAVNRYLNANLLDFPFSVPENRGSLYRQGKKKESGLGDFRFINKLKNEDDELVDIFDKIPDVDDSYEYLNKDYVDDYIKDCILKYYKNEKETQQLLMRYLCVGEYKDFPELSLHKFSEEQSVSSRCFHQKISNRIRKMRTPKLRKVIVGTA